MKKLLIISAVCCSLQLFIGTNWERGTCYAQGTWTQKADFGGTARSQAVAFSIGTKGYIGTGFANTGNTKDFWQWDQTTNAWTQEADFGGTPRSTAVGFSIGTKGYIGLGYDVFFVKDFWQWNQTTNVWTQKTDFGGTARVYAVAFSIGTKGYVGTGEETPGFTPVQDFWEYDQPTDTWTKKSDFGGGVRASATGFSIGNKGYIGTGYDDLFVARKDFWEFDPATNAWTQKADVGTDGRYFCAAFSIGTKGYIGTGNPSPTFIPTQEFLEWDQATNTWTDQTPFPAAPRFYASGFSIGTKGYLGLGIDTGYVSHTDFWEFSGDTIVSTGCSVPVGELADPARNYVTLSWNVVPEATSYKVRYRASSSATWIGAASPTNVKSIRPLIPNTSYVWKVRSICGIGHSAFSPDQTFTTDPMKLSAEQPMSFDVFPDPFESSTSISFSLLEDSRVQLELFDVAGRKMQTILDDNVAAGNHLVTMNRNQLNAGLYFLQMRMSVQDESGQVEVITKKVMIVQ